MITIFIPTYQRPQMLKRAIKSCQNQSLKPIKIIVLDNASNDKTPEITEKIAREDPRVSYIRHPQNLGMLGNYQFGMSHVDTEFFSFLSDDDVLLPHFCETALVNFNRYPKIAFSACSTVILSSRNDILEIPLGHWPREGLFFPQEAIAEMEINKYPVPTTVLFQTQYASKATIDFSNPTLWDVDFLIQLAAQFPIAISKKICGVFISHESSFTKNKDFVKPLQQLLQRIESFPHMEPAIRSTALAKVAAHLQKILTLSVMSNLLHKRFSAAKATMQGVIAEKFTLKYLFFLATAHFFSYFPRLNFLLVFAKKVRDRKAKRNRIPPQKLEDEWLLSIEHLP